MADDPPNVLVAACEAISRDSIPEASGLLTTGYPVMKQDNAGRNYTLIECMRVFVRDGFTDRYSGKRLVFPGALRLLTQLLPDAFPYHANWKVGFCHQAYWELFPTIDHIVPITRGGNDSEENWITTSMLKNQAKGHNLLEKLGWSVLASGNCEWDGLARWCLREMDRLAITNIYIRRWVRAAREVLGHE